jgi:hypothetical protein
MFGRQKQKQEFASFRSPAGEPVRVPFHRTPVTRVVRYGVISDPLSTIGELIDAAVGAGPALCDHGLLDPADVGRLATMLHGFRGFRQTAAADPRPSGELGLDLLGRRLRAWVLDRFDGGGGARLSALFALEAAYFLEAIAFGARQQIPREIEWELAGLAKLAGRDDGVGDDRTFKRRFTQSLGGLTLLARAEDDLEVWLPGRDTIVIPTGDEFRFTVWTCPLSETGPDRVEFVLPRWELLRGCWPFGAIYFAENRRVGRDGTDAPYTVPAHGNLPTRWITHYLDRAGEVGAWRPAPQFEWAVGA